MPSGLEAVAPVQQTLWLFPPPLLIVRGAPILGFERPASVADNQIAVAVLGADLLLGQRPSIRVADFQPAHSDGTSVPPNS